jgi:hypothetical protein
MYTSDAFVWLPMTIQGAISMDCEWTQEHEGGGTYTTTSAALDLGNDVLCNTVKV